MALRVDTFEELASLLEDSLEEELPAEIKLDVKGIGSLTVQPWQEPADMVEAFAAQAIKNGEDVSITYYDHNCINK